MVSSSDLLGRKSLSMGRKMAGLHGAVYNTKREAKKSLYWRMCSGGSTESIVKWITSLFRRDEWWNLQCEDGGGDPSPSVPVYLILGSNHGSVGIQGNEFACLQLYLNQVTVRIRDSTFSLCDCDPYSHPSAVIRKKNCRRRLVYNHLPARTEKAKVGKPSVSNSLHKHIASARVVDAGGVIGKMFVDEPFTTTFGSKFSSNDKEQYLREWSHVWGDVLDDWLSYYYPRKASGGFCHYWLPPGVATSPLRSARDIFDFLEIAKQPGLSPQDAHRLWRHYKGRSGN